MNRKKNINATSSINKTINKNKTNSASFSRIQSASSDVFDNSDMDMEGTVNNFKKSRYRNLLSSGEPAANKLANTTQKNILLSYC